MQFYPTGGGALGFGLHVVEIYADVPEPATIGLLLCGLPLLLKRRRRRQA